MTEASFHLDIPPALILGELARISASAHLRRAQQLQRLLSYLVQSTLSGDTSRLREVNIALECFGRSPSRYDPRTDPIVRVAANRLRSKLATYYADEGTLSYVRISIPIGSYVPSFARQQPAAVADDVTHEQDEGLRRRAKSRADPVGAEARGLYDRARFALRQQDANGFRKAIELFERATRVAPRFAEGWSGLALAYLALVGMVAVPSMPDVEAARSAVLRALKLDPQLGEAYASLASIVFRYELDWDRAEPLYRQAILLAPESRYAHHSYAFALTMNGRFDEAEAHYQIALDVDPLDQTLRCQHALMPIYTGRYEAAEAALLAILDVDQQNILAHALLGATYLYANKPARALSRYQWIIEHYPEVSIGWCGRAQALSMLRMRKKARAILERMIAESGEHFVSAYQIAMIQARLGRDNAAIEWLDRAATQRDANFICAPVDPAFAKLRLKAEWFDLMRRHGLGAAAARISRVEPLTPPSRSSRGSAAYRRRYHA